MRFAFTSAELDSYAKRGFVVRESAFAPGELASLRDAVESIHAKIGDAARAGGAPVERVDGLRYQTLLASRVKWEWAEESDSIRSMEPLHHLDPRIEDLIDDPRLYDPARSVLGCDRVSLFTDKLNFKRPGGSPFPWHQDTPYWAFGCEHLDMLVSLQIYLDDATSENGCLWVIPESHRSGNLPALDDRGTLGRLYTDVAKIDAADPLALEAPAGSVIFFDGYIVHGSKRNRSDQSRRAIVLTYQPPGLPRWNTDAVRPVPRDRRD